MPHEPRAFVDFDPNDLLIDEPSWWQIGGRLLLNFAIIIGIPLGLLLIIDRILRLLGR